MGFDDNNRSVGSLSRGYEDIVAVIRAGVGTEVAVDRPRESTGARNLLRS
jgi:hypothetical protein